MDIVDGLVEVIDEEDVVPFNESSGFSSYITLLFTLIEKNGWFILIAFVIFYLLYNKYKDKLFNRITQSTHREVDEEKELRRLHNIEAARQRQQAALDAAAVKYLEEKKLKDEKIAKEKAEEWERHQQGLGYHSKTKKQEDDLSSLGLSQRNKLGNTKPKLRGTDYNPLTGQSNSPDGPSCSFRPSRKGGNKGG